MKITIETLKDILLKKADDAGEGVLEFERLLSSNYRTICKYKFSMSKITKDGFWFRDHDTQYVIDVLNNKLCECKIL
jgi:hypothetical protein